jgi:YVTN family beta-propeller protein
MKTLLLVLLAACGDNQDKPDAGPTGDSGTSDARVAMPRAIAAAGDFGSPGVGTLAKLDITSLEVTQNVVPGAALGDPVLREIDGKLYVINRYGSNAITILDAKTLALEDQISTGLNSNPQDVAVVGDKLYVPALGTTGVVVITRGSPTQTTIDLSGLDTVGANDGMPECVSAIAVGTAVYVACGVLDSFASVEPGKVAIIDSTTDTLLETITLNYGNPYGFFVATPPASTYVGDLLIETAPSLTDYTTGCLERVSTATPHTAACGLSNTELAGFANKLAIDDTGGNLYIAVGTYDASFSNPTGKLRSFDLHSGMLATQPLSNTSELIVDVAACPGGNIVATDQTLNAGGLRVWKKNGSERTTTALSIGLPPTTNALVCSDP